MSTKRGYLLGSSKHEQDRLYDHLESFGQKRLLGRVRPGMRILDVGCGPGAVSALLARATGPEGRVVGVDLSEEHLARARAHAEVEGLSNVRFEWADASDLPFSLGVFDLVYSKFLLMHVPAREEVLDEMVRVLAPGGTLFVYDTEAGASLFWPEGTAAHRAWALSMRALQEGGADPELGRKLYGLLVGAGLQDVRAVPEATGACASQPRFMRGAKRQIAGMLQSLRELVKGQGIDDDEVDALVEELEEDAPHEFFMLCGLAVWGTKPL
jgi:ubiquinone/menaquinone biosynthesis C-methylase UbiE